MSLITRTIFTLSDDLRMLYLVLEVYWSVEHARNDIFLPQMAGSQRRGLPNPGRRRWRRSCRAQVGPDEALKHQQPLFVVSNTDTHVNTSPRDESRAANQHYYNTSTHTQSAFITWANDGWRKKEPKTKSPFTQWWKAIGIPFLSKKNLVTLNAG